MRTSELSFISASEKFTVNVYRQIHPSSVIGSEVISRLAASILLSPAAALDIAFHSLLVLPTFVYAIGKSIYLHKADFTLPWQHIQRVRNAVAPLFLGSVFGLMNPFVGIAMSEPTDKHAVIGMLSSNTNQNLETPCSPIHSLGIIEGIAKAHRYVNVNGVKKEIFTAEHLKILKETQGFEKSLETLQAQEFIHKITNVTLFVMIAIIEKIVDSSLNDFSKIALLKFSGCLIPVLTTVDITITLIAQAFFITTGAVRLISGRGPIYTEVTTNPLMHVSFLIQNILKSVGNLLGTGIWFVSPLTAFEVSLIPANLFFKLQMSILMLQVKLKMHFAEDDSRFVVPIVFGEGECSALAFPTHSMHKTYLIVEKKNDAYNLFWVNRPEISVKKALSTEETLVQIRSMLDERFPFMDVEKLLNYPVQSKKPEFPNSVNFAKIPQQGGPTNCVVSNLFGMFEALDLIKDEDRELTTLRYKTVREVLIKDYQFYKKDFFPFTNSENLSLKPIWNIAKEYPQAAI